MTSKTRFSKIWILFILKKNKTEKCHVISTEFNLNNLKFCEQELKEKNNKNNPILIEYSCGVVTHPRQQVHSHSSSSLSVFPYITVSAAETHTHTQHTGQ